jgi:hypothetical protein
MKEEFSNINFFTKAGLNSSQMEWRKFFRQAQLDKYGRYRQEKVLVCI